MRIEDKLAITKEELAFLYQQKRKSERTKTEQEKIENLRAEIKKLGGNKK